MVVVTNNVPSEIEKLYDAEVEGDEITFRHQSKCTDDDHGSEVSEMMPSFKVRSESPEFRQFRELRETMKGHHWLMFDTDHLDKLDTEGNEVKSAKLRIFKTATSDQHMFPVSVFRVRKKGYLVRLSFSV